MTPREEEKAASGEAGGQGEDGAAGGSRHAHDSAPSTVSQAENVAHAAWVAAGQRRMDALRRDREFVRDLTALLWKVKARRETSPPVADVYVAAAIAWLTLVVLLAEAEREEELAP